jgi:putative transposase
MHESDMRRGRHCVSVMHVHLVFVPKYRRKVFTADILSDMKEIFDKVCLDFDCELIEFNGEVDHVHLLINYPPKVAISILVNSLKGVSSRLLRKKNYPSISKKLWGDHLWSPSYFCSTCGGAPIDILRKYIEEQKAPD